MQSNYKYLVGILLPEPWKKRIKDIQLKFKTEAWNISLDPHITLLPPARAIGEDADIILENIAKGFDPFEILVDGLGSFNNDSKTVFAKVRDTHEVFRLHKELEEVGTEFMDLNIEELKSKPFHPHFTLANRLGDEAKQKEVLGAIQETWTPFSFVCDSFSLFKKYPEEKQWSEVRKYTF